MELGLGKDLGESKVRKAGGSRQNEWDPLSENLPPECGNCSDSDFPPKADKHFYKSKKTDDFILFFKKKQTGETAVSVARLGSVHSQVELAAWSVTCAVTSLKGKC